MTKRQPASIELPIPVFSVSDELRARPLTRSAARVAGGSSEYPLEDLFLEGESRTEILKAVRLGQSRIVYGLAPRAKGIGLYTGMWDGGSRILCLLGGTEAEDGRQEVIAEYAALKTEMSLLKKELAEMDGLIRNVAHDLRSPLATALSFCDLIVETNQVGLPDDSKEFLGHVYTAIRNALGIAEDLLRFGQLDAPAGRHVSLPSLGDELARDFSVQASDGTLEQDWGVETVWADPVTLYRILSNLLGNAIKYRRSDSPLYVRIRSRSLDHRVRIEAEDNGRGIPQDDRERVFTRLERADSSTRGHGIGLATVHRLVRRSGGEMGIADGIDGGTMIWVELPLKELEGSRDVTGLMTGAIMSHAKGDISTAVRRVEEAMSIGSDNPGHWAIAASIYRSAGRAADAEHALKEAIRLNPNRAEYHIDLAIHYAKQAKVADARKFFRCALSLDDRDPHVLENYGTYLALIEKRPDEAAVLWRRALERGSRKTSLLLNLAERALIDGSETEANRLLGMINLSEEPSHRRTRAQALWVLLDLLSGNTPKVDSLARLAGIVPSAHPPSPSADYSELRRAVTSKLSAHSRELAVAILDILDGKKAPKALQPFLLELSHGEQLTR